MLFVRLAARAASSRVRAASTRTVPPVASVASANEFDVYDNELDFSKLNTGLELVFLGTSSTPTAAHHTVSTAVRLATGDVFIVDAGEGTQRRLMQCDIRPTRIHSLFVTHMHGDHVNGVVPVVMFLKQAEIKRPFHIWGPPGIRQFVRSALRSTYATLRELRVHELVPEPRDKAGARVVSLPGGDLDVFPDGAGVWHLPVVVAERQQARDGLAASSDDDSPGVGADDAVSGASLYSVQAAAIEHRPQLTCLGFAFQERAFRGNLDVAKLAALGLQPGPWVRPLLQGLDATEPRTGQLVRAAPLLTPSTPGRKIAILGDTCDASGAAGIAQGCDVLVHEASLLHCDAGKAFERGHATTSMAGAFARRVGAATLIINHLSPKYVRDPAGSPDGLARLRAETCAAFGSQRVVVAQDSMRVRLARRPAGSARPRPVAVLLDDGAASGAARAAVAGLAGAAVRTG